MAAVHECARAVFFAVLEIGDAKTDGIRLAFPFPAFAAKRNTCRLLVLLHAVIEQHRLTNPMQNATTTARKEDAGRAIGGQDLIDPMQRPKGADAASALLALCNNKQ